jgi:SLT domain-containing protein
MKNAMTGIGDWVNNNIVQPVLNWVKSHFGITSPATVMVPVGEQIVAGMLKGIFTSAHDIGGFIIKAFGDWPHALLSFLDKGLVDAAKIPEKVLTSLVGLLGKLGGAAGGILGKIGGAFSRIFGGGGGGGVGQWAGVVAAALALNGLPLSLVGQVLYQIQTESGGDPGAVNLTDINAQMGDPSKGLLQTIGSTFAAYHIAGTSSNIFDPLANVAAAINYAKNVYGPSLMSGGMGLGSGHGYDTGGWLPPGVSLAWNMTGQHEQVLPPGTSVRGGDGATYHAHFDGLTGAAIENHVRVAFLAMDMQAGSQQRQGRRS